MAAISDVSDALDLKGLTDMKRQVREGSAEGTRNVAREFEAMFLNMMLKGMRDSLPHDDPLESDATRMGTSMLDGQLAQSMAGKGLGLAEAIVQQIERNQGNRSQAATNGAAPPSNGLPPVRGKDVSPIPRQRALQLKTSAVQQSFVDMHRQAAEAASRVSGIPAKVILGQAALESGWGKHEVRDASGTGSFNLFGIKADANWKGPTVDAMTTEFVNGMAQKVVQKFRAYASYADSFLDYAKTVTSNPRYGQVMQLAGDAVRFAQEMGRSGYATDPQYGEKLTRIMRGPLRDLG